ncbi:MAG: VWA domain-containing protein [Clostridia bacterium]|nr:VWA domain-containing protein [Clostridia bacterium]
MDKPFENLPYGIDMVFCFDMTGGMVALEGFIYEFKDFYVNYNESFEACGREIKKFRIRFVLFKDYAVDPEPMVESQFFTLPEDMEEAFAFAATVGKGGGGDLPENSLEALSIAMDSEWDNEYDLRRRIIVLVTDASPLALGKRADCPAYPENMPKSIEELREKWDSLGRWRRMYLFAPSCEEWDRLCEWDCVWQTQIPAGACASDVEYFPVLVDSFY